MNKSFLIDILYSFKCHVMLILVNLLLHRFAIFLKYL